MASITIELPDHLNHGEIAMLIPMTLVRMSNRFVVNAIPKEGDPSEERVWKDRFNGPAS